jgi:hypothetical protein
VKFHRIISLPVLAACRVQIKWTIIGADLCQKSRHSMMKPCCDYLCRRFHVRQAGMRRLAFAQNLPPRFEAVKSSAAAYSAGWFVL